MTSKKEKESFLEGFNNNAFTKEGERHKKIKDNLNITKSDTGRKGNMNIGNNNNDENGHCLGIPSGVSLQLPSGCRFGVFRSHTLTSTLRNSAGLH